MALNRTQRVIVGIGGCLVLLALLFPPMVRLGMASFPCDSWFIFDTPPRYCKVNFVALLLRIAAILMGTTLLVWCFHPRQAITQSPSEKTSERGSLRQLHTLSGPIRFLLLVALWMGLLTVFGMLYAAIRGTP